MVFGYGQQQVGILGVELQLVDSITVTHKMPGEEHLKSLEPTSYFPPDLMQFMLAGLKTLMIPLQPPAARTGLPVSLSQLQAVLQQVIGQSKSP